MFENKEGGRKRDEKKTAKAKRSLPEGKKKKALTRHKSPRLRQKERPLSSGPLKPEAAGRSLC